MPTPTPTPEYVGIIDLGPSYSPAQWETDAYVWDSLDDVRASLASVRAGRGACNRVAYPRRRYLNT